mgnify:FL=1
MQLTKRWIIIGEAPSRNGDPKKPITGRPGRCLARAAFGAAADVPRFLAGFERKNLIGTWPGQEGKGSAWPVAAARKAAGTLLPELAGRTAILLGKRVARAFGMARLAYFAWAPIKVAAGMRPAWVVVVPHPSGINRWWNDAANRKKAGGWLRVAWHDSLNTARR